MAKNIQKILAWVMVLTLLAGQLAIPAAAEEVTQEPAAAVEVTVDAAPAVPEVPAASSQAPAESESMSVSISEPATSSAPSSSSEGVTEQSTSTTTTWSGSEGGTDTSGSETTTTVTGTDDITGQTLYEGGTTSGAESSVTTSQPDVNTETQEGFVTKQIDTTIENTSSESGTASSTSPETSSTTEGSWENTENGFTEGQFQADKTVEKKETTDQITLGSEEIPEDGIHIDLDIDNQKSDPKQGVYTFTGTANGEFTPLEEGVSIPDGADLVKDASGNTIGYTLSTSTETITGTEIKEGSAQHDAANSSTDTSGSTATVTPDLDTAKQNLGIHIDDHTQINEEKNDGGQVVAYVITNTTKEEYEIGTIGQLERPEAGSFQQEDGTTLTRTVEDTLDAEGNAVVKIIEVQTDASGKELNRSETTQTIIENQIPTEAEPTVIYTLPEKPEASVKTEDGVTTTVTVTDIVDENGKVIGYKATTIQTDASGAELYREENDLYGTEETVTKSIASGNPRNESTATVKKTVVTTNRVTAEETTFEDIAAYSRLNEIVNNMTVDKTNEVVMIDGKLYYIYTGSVTVSEGKNHGDTSLMNPITPMSALFAKSDSLDLDLGGDLHADNDKAPADGFKYIGHGIDSALSVNKTYGSASANQFRLKSADGKIYFALCIDFETGIEAGHLYDIEDIDDADYLTDGTAEKIRSIALNGYWGTESGVGSMSDVQELLVSYLTTTKKMSKANAQKIANSLTPGQALAATQAALWTYGDSGSDNPVQVNNLISNRSNDSDDEINAEYLYGALIEAANSSSTQLKTDEGVAFLDAKDITATSIVVKEKIASADDEDNTTGKNVYNTDLNFTLGIQPTKLFGDLKVTVYDSNGKEVKSVILASKDKTLIGLKPDATGMYTISDIEIAEGVNVNLKLHGTQDLGTGVYIYTSLDGSFNKSQTLVTLATGSRTVDLDISMKLDVQEPTATRKVSGKTQYGTRTDTQEQSRTDQIQRKSTTTKNDWTTVKTDETASSLVYTSDVTLTSVSTKQTKEEKSWSFSWLKTYDPEPAPLNDDFPIDPSGDDPGKPDASRNTKLKKTLTIFDEQVPLAKAPKTGDLSGIWIAISGLSLGGIALLNAKRKEEE